MTGTEDGWEVARAAAGAAGEILGERALATYAIGSLAHGGFEPAVSDVDVALLTSERLGPSESDRIAASTEALLESELSRRLSLFHAPRTGFESPPPGSRFPTLDRLDLLRHGALISGQDLRAELPAPTRVEVIAAAVRFGLQQLDRRTPSLMIGDLPPTASLRETTKLVLLPVRLLFVAATGKVAGNDEAVSYYRETAKEDGLQVVSQALAWRRVGSLPDGHVVAELLNAQLLPLRVQVLKLLISIPDIPERCALESLIENFERA
ncbi:MAG: hypothetical protein WBL45_13245 [Solirubrobacterales bacterium]